MDYFLGQARKYWLELADRQSQAHLAVALKRFGDKASAAGDHALDQGAVGQQRGAGHVLAGPGAVLLVVSSAPIETQAMMIEAFDEVMDDAQAVEACKVWLLKQKQTQDWKTTKATADAVYALLLRGDNLLSLRRAGRGDAGRNGDQAREGRGRHRLLRAAVRRTRSRRSWPRSR